MAAGHGSPREGLAGVALESPEMLSLPVQGLAANQCRQRQTWDPNHGKLGWDRVCWVFFFPGWIPLFWYFCNVLLFFPPKSMISRKVLGPPGVTIFLFGFPLLYCDSIRLRFWNIFSRVHTSSVSFEDSEYEDFLFFILYLLFFPKAESITVNNLFILMVLEAFSTPPRRSEKLFKKRKGEKKNPPFFS